MSIDFVYRTASLRTRIEQLRADQQRTPPDQPSPAPQQQPSQSNIVRALTAQITALKRRHHA